MALRGGELVLLQWRSVNGSISSCIGSSTSSASSSSDADSLLAPCMSIVLTAFPSISLAPHRAAAHPPSRLASPHRAGSPPTLHISYHAACPTTSTLTHFQRACLAAFCRRSFCIRTKPIPLDRSHFDRVQHQHVKPSSGLVWPHVSQWPSPLSCRLQVVFEIFVLRPPVVLHSAHTSVPLLRTCANARPSVCEDILLFVSVYVLCMRV